jgi:hypothetical protein
MNGVVVKMVGSKLVVEVDIPKAIAEGVGGAGAAGRGRGPRGVHRSHTRRANVCENWRASARTPARGSYVLEPVEPVPMEVEHA